MHSAEHKRRAGVLAHNRPPAALAPLCALLACLCLAPFVAAQTIFIEAESFSDPGGWVIDQQFMDQMGSPFLLAHGLGTPVRDAVTTVTFPEIGDYRLFVRTRDWVPPHAPGKFRILIDGQPQPPTFGTTGGGKWIWQDGGTVHIDKTQASVALRDLTGFEGRCDALLFTKDQSLTPPDDLEQLAVFRKKALGLPDTPPDAGQYDLVVVGGGIAGMSAAVAAARLGLHVALIHDRPVLGGNNSTEINVAIAGYTNAGPFPRNSEIVESLKGMKEAPQRLRFVQAEKNVALFMFTHADGVEKDNGRIVALRARDVPTGREMRFRAPLFVDCTGDGTIGYLAGADYRMGREGRGETGESLAPEQPDKMHMGTTTYWWARVLDSASDFPQCPWALRFDENSRPVPSKTPLMTYGGWDWESGFWHDSVMEAEYIRDYNFRAIYGTWDYVKNQERDKELYRNWKLQWVSYVAGKRESRRLLGDVILTQQDLQELRRYPDGCVSTNWSIDIHVPMPEVSKFFPQEEYRGISVGPSVHSYLIPFRCLYSRNVPNLMMAGRDISVTHVALGSVRVMGTTGMMGTVTGRAAYLCRKYQCTPRQLYQEHLGEFQQFLLRPSVQFVYDASVKPVDLAPAKKPPPPSEMYCLNCGRDLHAVTTGLCPRCGRAFDPADRDTYTRHAHRGWQPHWWWAVAGCGLLPVGALVVWRRRARGGGKKSDQVPPPSEP